MEKQIIKKPMGSAQAKPMQSGHNKPRRHSQGGGGKFKRIDRSAIGKNWKETPGLKPMEWKPEENLKIIPLGGCEEVGRNMTVFEYGQDIIILDMGLQFPEEDMPGIDYVIPNVENLGNPQIIGRPLTIEMVKHRQEDMERNSSKKLEVTYIKTLEDTFTLGNFKLSFFQIDHTIMDAVGVILETPVATVIHPGDWTIEKDPIGRDVLHYHHLAKLKRPTILMLEALGAVNTKPPVTEKEMLGNINKLISQ